MISKCIFSGGRRKRNYILDQTNVYASARRRKMKSFRGFFRIAAVLQPEDPEMERRSRKRTVEDGKVVPETAVMEMKANFSIPEERDNLFDRIDFIELPRDKVVVLMEQYVKEGQEKRPPRDQVFRHDNRFQKNDQNMGYGQQGSRAGQNQSPYGQRPMMGGPPSKSPMMGGSGKSPLEQGLKSEPQWFSQGDGLLGKAPNQIDDPASKRLKLEQGGMGRGGQQQQGGALDLLKQQYDEAEQQDNSQWNQPPGGAPQSQDFMTIKEERHWPPQDTALALGAGMGVHGTPLSHHLATQAGALVVSHPPGTIPLTGALGTQPPPPPPPVLPGHLAQTAAGPAFVALTPLPPPGPPPTVVAMGGAGALGAAPPGFHAQLQQVDSGGQLAWSQGGALGQSSWQQSESHSSTTSTSSQAGADGSASRREWGQQGTDRQQGGWQGGQQQPWQDQSADNLQKGGHQPWQRSSGSQQQPWQGQEGSRDGSDKGSQQPWQQGGSLSQQQYWQSQERSADSGQKGWQGSDSNIESGNSWMQNQGAGDGSRSYDEGRDKYGGTGNHRDRSRYGGGYDSKMQGYGGDSSGPRFDDFSRPPPDARGSGRSDDFHGGDNREGRNYGSGGQSFGESGGNDKWSSHQRSGSNDRWSSSSSHQDRRGPSDSGDSRWSGGGRQDGREQSDRWGSRGQDRFSGGRDHDRGRDMDRSRDRDRGSDRDRERDRGSDRDRDRGSDRDRTGRDRDRDQDRDSYRDSYRDRERDRGSRDRDRDSSEPRQRRRKSKWDNPEDEAGTKTGDDSSFQPPVVKEEPPTSGFGDRDPPSSFQAGQQQNQQFFNRPGQYQPAQSEGNDGQANFPPRGMGFNRPPPASAAGPGGPSPGQSAPGNFPKDRSSDLPSLLDVQFGNRPPPPPAAGSKDQPSDDSKSGTGETSLLGPVPSSPPPRFQGTTGGSSTPQSQSSPMPNTSVPPPRDGPPPPPFGSGNRPPFQPGAGSRFSGPNVPEGNAMGGGQRPGFRMEGPLRPMRPRNPQNFSGPPGGIGQMGGPPPNAPWNQNRFGGGRGMPPRPRFDGPGGPGGGRFPGGPGPMRWPRGPR